ncbi:glycosyltransferase [Pontibacter saemangeumensis]|uniref:glycosyltransferase family 4 protein n=1 Tax=Pontibacter saemangeumensis TaxID=1084525 RepID=UPI0031ED3844
MISIDWFVPGFKAGGPIQSCANLVAHLKGEFEFYIITRNTDYVSTEQYPGITANTWHQIEPGVQVYYFSADNLNFQNVKKVLRGVQADVIYINGIFSRFFSIYTLLIARSSKMKVIVAARGMFAPSAVNVKNDKKKLFFLVAKAVGLYNKVTFHASNLTEVEHIRAILGDKIQVSVASNLPKILNTNTPFPTIKKEQGKLKLVSVARVSPEKNTKYALEVLSNYVYEGQIEFTIFGPVYDAKYWEVCEAIITSLPSNISVIYEGSLDSKHVPAALQEHHVLFLPTRGENFGHIILESLSAGLPVLISDKTPWLDLQEKHVGYDLPLAEPTRFKEAITVLLALKQEEYDEMSASVRSFAAHYVADTSIVAANRALFS